MIIPQFDSEAFTQSYSAIFAGDYPTTIGCIFADATDDVTYQSGVIVALLTGGSDAGKYINYVDGESDGQGTPVGVIVDDNIVVTGTPGDSVMISVALAQWNCVFLKEALIDLPAGTVADAITALGLKSIPFTLGSTTVHFLYPGGNL